MSEIEKMYSETEKLIACQIYIDYVMQGAEGLGAMGAMMFSDDKRIELHNELLKVFGLTEQDKDLLTPITDNLCIFRPDAKELKRQIERILKEEKDNVGNN